MADPAVRGLRGVRQGARREGALSGGGALQGLGLLLDGLRQGGAQEPRRRRTAMRSSSANDSAPSKDSGSSEGLGLHPRAQQAPPPPTSEPRRTVADGTAGRSGCPGGGGCGGRGAGEHRDRGEVLLGRRGSPTGRRSSAARRRAGSAAPVSGSARFAPSRAGRARPAERSVVSGATRSSPTNGSRAKVRTLVSFAAMRLHDRLLPLAAGEVVLAWVELVLADRASRSARACRPCAACPCSNRQPSHCSQRDRVAYGQSNRFERIGFGTSTSMPPSASITVAEVVEVDEHDVVRADPGQRAIVFIASAGPPSWKAALILFAP